MLLNVECERTRPCAARSQSRGILAATGSTTITSIAPEKTQSRSRWNEIPQTANGVVIGMRSDVHVAVRDLVAQLLEVQLLRARWKRQPHNGRWLQSRSLLYDTNTARATRSSAPSRLATSSSIRHTARFN